MPSKTRKRSKPKSRSQPLSEARIMDNDPVSTKSRQSTFRAASPKQKSIYFQDLPTEIILETADHVTDYRDLANLSFASRFLYSILAAKLHKIRLLARTTNAEELWRTQSGHLTSYMYLDKGIMRTAGDMGVLAAIEWAHLNPLQASMVTGLQFFHGAKVGELGLQLEALGQSQRPVDEEDRLWTDQQIARYKALKQSLDDGVWVPKTTMELIEEPFRQLKDDHPLHFEDDGAEQLKIHKRDIGLANASNEGILALHTSFPNVTRLCVNMGDPDDIHTDFEVVRDVIRKFNFILQQTIINPDCFLPFLKHLEIRGDGTPHDGRMSLSQAADACIHRSELQSIVIDNVEFFDDDSVSEDDDSEDEGSDDDDPEDDDFHTDDSDTDYSEDDDSDDDNSEEDDSEEDDSKDSDSEDDDELRFPIEGTNVQEIQITCTHGSFQNHPKHIFPFVTQSKTLKKLLLRDNTPFRTEGGFQQDKRSIYVRELGIELGRRYSKTLTHLVLESTIITTQTLEHVGHLHKELTWGGSRSATRESHGFKPPLGSLRGFKHLTHLALQLHQILGFNHAHMAEGRWFLGKTTELVHPSYYPDAIVGRFVESCFAKIHTLLPATLRVLGIYDGAARFPVHDPWHYDDGMWVSVNNLRYYASVCAALEVVVVNKTKWYPGLSTIVMQQGIRNTVQGPDPEAFDELCGIVQQLNTKAEVQNIEIVDKSWKELGRYVMESELPLWEHGRDDLVRVDGTE